MLIANAEVAGRAPLDVRVEEGRVTAVGADLARRSGEVRIDARGGALLPGLHDHHLHLFALAAARRSVRCGPPEVRDAQGLAERLAETRDRGGPRDWIRGVGYHESVAGRLDRQRLDAWVPDRPLRIQQRSGALWLLNSVALRRLDVERDPPPGLERDAHGAPTGRLYRADAWLRERLGRTRAPDLRATSAALARCGVTGVTDATPDNGLEELRALGGALARGELAQRVHLMGRTGLPRPAHPHLSLGPVKLRLDEPALPEFEAFREAIAAAHEDGRAAAVHCVTRTELVFALAAFQAAGCRPGDRIEHAAIADGETLALMAALPLTVVTQPNFVAERGDAYRREVPSDDHPHLYRCRGFDAVGVELGGGTDAPFGSPDPWRAMRAAVDRRAPDGAPLGPEEAVTPERALALFTTPADAPGAQPRGVAPGVPADLCLLDRPWAEARRSLSVDTVAATWRDGCPTWRA